MTTLSSDIFDYFLTSVDDYKLTSIYTTSGSLVLDTYLEPWLLNSIIEFEVCEQDLSYTASSGSSEGYFTETLTSENKFMLAQLMTKYWLQKNIQNVLFMANLLQDRDFRQFSAANNLKAKQDYYIMKCEELNQRLTDYGYKKNDWENWRNQIFY